jgi:sodium bicarbonate transporter 10
VTHIVVFILIGVSVFMAPMLGYIPMPVLFGLFLFMGVASLNGLQMFDRLSLFLMPKKYQPDLTYLRRVPLSRVHMFTGIQLLCLVGLWVIKDIKNISILFPIMVIILYILLKILKKSFKII